MMNILPNVTIHSIAVKINGKLTFLDFRYFADGSMEMVRDQVNTIFTLDK